MSNLSSWKSVKEEVRGEIMKTDIYCEIVCREEEVPRARAALGQAFDLFRKFEAKYSRFRRGNALWKLNESTQCIVSPELFSILQSAQHFHRETSGLFDPSILPALEQEGYTGAYAGDSQKENGASFGELTLDQRTLTVTKPRSLKIDLGGIGKGFIVDAVGDFLSEQFSDFLVDAGGDIVARGKNRVLDYPYWAIDVEDPMEQERSLATLLLRTMAVATSGSNRKTWQKNGEQKHHLIDPRTKKSARSDFLTVTVIAPSALEADVLAKSLFLSAKERAFAFAEKKKIPALFVTQDREMVVNSYCEPYVWKAS